VKVLAFAIGDSALSKIIRGQLNRHAVARDYPDKMLAHLACDVSYDLMAVFKLYPELCPWQGLNDCPRELDYFFINSHKYNNS
jgi:hypothetical protein